MEQVVLFSLLLLFSSGLCAVNGTDLGTTTSLAVCQPDTCTIISELAAMREKMEAMSQAQRSLTDSLKDTVQQLATVQAKLQASSELVQDLKRDVQDLKTENQGLKTEVQGLKTENQAQDEQLKSLKDVVATGRATVAFSATLGKPLGPFQQDMPVKYPRVLSNVGSGYNPATGSFTAPLRGVYYFVYTMFNGYNSGRANSVLALMKNSEVMVTTWDTVDGDYNDSATNTVVVQLEAGDSVYVRLTASRQVMDDNNNYNSFAGFLLFAV